MAINRSIEAILLDFNICSKLLFLFKPQLTYLFSMKTKWFSFIGMLLTSLAGAQSLPPPNFTLDENVQIAVHNRILAKVNGKPISVMDVMKKMDMIFYSQFPEYTESKTARYQFYSVNWKNILQDLVNKELVLADAEDIKLPITSGDIRQEMESLFGPNIIANLDKIGISFDEAWKIVKGDITIRRMMFYRVNSKALRQIGPKELRTAYEDYSKKNVISDEWHYRVISIRDKDANKGSSVAEQIEKLIEESSDSFEALTENIKKIPNIEKSTTINISEEFVHNDIQLSPLYKEILSLMPPKSYTPALPQKSRSDKSTVYRIFYLNNKIEGSTASFNEIEFEIKEKLLQEAIEKETDLYLKKLRQHFAVKDNMLKEMVPDDFQPFTIQ